MGAPRFRSTRQSTGNSVPDRLYGRDDALRLTAGLLDRRLLAQQRPNREAPALVFVGQSGSGKTALLDGIAHQLDEYVPYARIDCAAGGGRTPQLLFALAFALNHRRGAYGSLAFPRLIVGQMIIAEARFCDGMPGGQSGELIPANPDPRAHAAWVLKALERYRDRARMRAFLQDLSVATLPAVGEQVPGADVIAKILPGLIVDGVITPLGRRFSAIGRGRHWYGSRAGVAADVTELVKLNINYHENDVEAHRQWVDALLSAAFLADLQDAFRRRRRLSRSPFNSAILVDNADTPEGLDFLVDFGQARADHVLNTRTVPPVTVIAASRGTYARRKAPDLRFQPLPRADAEKALREPDTDLPVTLPDLAAEDVRSLANRQRVTARHLPAMVFQFTRGHPDATASLLRAAAGAHGPVGIASLLDATDDRPATDARTIGERLLGGFLRDLGEHQREQLVTMSAARNRDDAGLLTPRRGPAAKLSQAVLAVDLWQQGDPAQAAVLPPVLRRLLMRRLARRDGDGAPNWETAHRRLRPDAAWQTLDEPDRVRDLYHALALGELRLVSRRLADWHAGMDTERWLALVKQVVVAPRQAPAGDDPAKEAEDLASSVAPDGDDPDRQQSIAALVAGLWIAEDPFTGVSRQDLHLGIAAGYDEVARLSRRKSELLREAQSHREEARRWPA